MTGAPQIPQDVRTLIIHLPSWVGDVVMATPVLRGARAACPAARIIALMRPGMDDLLAGCPDIDEMLPVDGRGFRGVVASARAVRRAQANAAFLLPNSFRSALAMRLGGVPIRVGYARDGRAWLLTARVPVDRAARPVAAVDYYAHLAEIAFGQPLEDRSLALTVTVEERAAADRLLEGAVDSIVIINPGANRPDKRWPIDRFAEVARRVSDGMHATVGVTGSPTERPLTAELCRELGGGAIDLAARGVTLGALKAVLHRAALLITNDTGPRHIAAAVGTPAIVLFGPTDHRWTTLPGAREHLLVAEPFLPEDQIADDHARVCAIERIAVSDVLDAARRMLAQPKSHAHSQ